MPLAEAGAAGDYYPLQVGVCCTLAFPYGVVGVQSFRHVLELRCDDDSGALTGVDSQATGSTLTLRKDSPVLISVQKNK